VVVGAIRSLAWASEPSSGCPAGCGGRAPAAMVVHESAAGIYFGGGSTGESSARAPMTPIIRQRSMIFSIDVPGLRTPDLIQTRRRQSPVAWKRTAAAAFRIREDLDNSCSCTATVHPK
jgi:hypothetical protein